jgi:hypothetical protein
MCKNRILVYALSIILFFPLFCYSAKYETSSFIIKYPDGWSPAFMEPRLTLIPEDNVIVTVDSLTASSVRKEINPIKIKSGNSQPVNILDVLSHDYVSKAYSDGWKLSNEPKIIKTGPYKTIYTELSKDDSFMALQIFEKDNIYVFSLATKNADKFKSYNQVLQNIIAKGFYIKAGNPIYMVIGMTIAYLASLVGLIAAYIYYKKRQGV